FARVTQNGTPITRADVHAGAEGIGPLAGDRVDAIYGFAGSAAVAHFAVARPAEFTDRRFGLQILGSNGCIDLKTGWLPPAYLLAGPSWSTTSSDSKWVEITSAGIGNPEP